MDTIKSDWVGWDNKDKCPLCKREGSGIATVWKKGHGRSNGIILEDGISYCKECAFTAECQEHWNKWWKESWKKQEQLCEENWAKHGVYTNVGGTYGEVSFYFGYAKTEKGLRPYLEVYPDCPRYKLERSVSYIMSKYMEFGSPECRRLITEKVAASTANEDFKNRVVSITNENLDRLNKGV